MRAVRSHEVDPAGGRRPVGGEGDAAAGRRPLRRGSTLGRSCGNGRSSTSTTVTSDLRPERVTLLTTIRVESGDQDGPVLASVSSTSRVSRRLCVPSAFTTKMAACLLVSPDESDLADRPATTKEPRLAAAS